MSEIQIEEVPDLFDDPLPTTTITPETTQVEKNISEEKKRDGFVERVRSLPIILALVYWTSETYNRVKSSYVFIQPFCQRAETGIQQAIQQVDKMLTQNKLVAERLVQFDSMACSLLTRLESAVPAIRSEPSVLIEQIKGLWSSLRQKVSVSAQTERLRGVVENQTSHSVAKLTNIYSEARKRVTVQVQNKLSLTKDKIELYREYLDVLSKQFVVQDGRSLEHIHVSQ